MFNLAAKAACQGGMALGGEAQRVAIARALINNPAVIIADEPTAHLDTKLSREFMDIIRNFKAKGKTILIASHDPIVYESAWSTGWWRCGTARSSRPGKPECSFIPPSWRCLSGPC